MGLPFHRLDHRALIQVFLEGARRGEGRVDRHPESQILRQFTADPESRKLILAASHRVADGLPIVWASRLAGTPVPERIPGSDLVLSLPEAAERGRAGGVPPGGNPGVAAAAARRLESRCPGLQRWRPIALPSDLRTIPRSSTGSRGRFDSPDRPWSWSG